MRPSALSPLIALPVLLLTLGTGLAPAAAPWPQTVIDPANWGSVTAPVYGSSEAAPYQSAELFAGPHKFGVNYFDGVLPNGRIVRPAGVTTQVGMNPLGATPHPRWKYLITSNDDERDGGLTSLINQTNIGGYFSLGNQHGHDAGRFAGEHRRAVRRSAGHW